MQTAVSRIPAVLEYYCFPLPFASASPVGNPFSQLAPYPVSGTTYYILRDVLLLGGGGWRPYACYTRFRYVVPGIFVFVTNDFKTKQVMCEI